MPRHLPTGSRRRIRKLAPGHLAPAYGSIPICPVRHADGAVKAGTTLVRDWHGRTHIVGVLERECAYNRLTDDARRR